MEREEKERDRGGTVRWTDLSAVLRCCGLGPPRDVCCVAAAAVDCRARRRCRGRSAAVRSLGPGSWQVASDISLTVQLQLGPACSLAAAAAVVCRN